MICDGKIDGDIMLRNISFKYESRSIHLFENFNLTIPYGKKVGFVGVSGCGKSTILSFLLRFYIPQ
jgi:ABC-type bacteriocin/lantibiotic exporter with double-glycine peptidase domain